jgi:hypothetical protein
VTKVPFDILIPLLRNFIIFFLLIRDETLPFIA